MSDAEHMELKPSERDFLLDEVKTAHDAGDFSRVLDLCQCFPAAADISQYDMLLASAFFRLARYNEAIDALDRYARDSGDDCHAPVERLKLLYLAGRWSEVVTSGAKILMDAAWFLSPREIPAAWLMVAFASAQLGDQIGSWRALKEIESLGTPPDETQFLSARAAIRNKIFRHDSTELIQIFLPKIYLVPGS